MVRASDGLVFGSSSSRKTTEAEPREVWVRATP
jgi:hypothetical protein